MSAQVQVPAGIHLHFLHPYSPELQPAERLWPLANEVFVVDPSYWTERLVVYNLFSDRRAYDGATAQIHREVQDPSCP